MIRKQTARSALFVSARQPGHLSAAAVLLLTLLVWLTLGSGVWAASITVNTTADEVTTNGACSLREAVINANDDAATFPDCAAGSGADDITLPAGTFSLAIPGAGEDLSATGDLDVNSVVTLTGAGVGITIIDGGGIDRVFDLFGSTDAVIEDLTIRGGSAGSGAGINARAGSDTILSRVSISDNSATGSGGGGIAVSIATVTLNDSTMDGNTANSGSGGGISAIAGSVLIINNSTISNNSAGSGGGIDGSTTTITVYNSTLSGNSAGAGAAIYSEDNAGNTSDVQITSSTVVAAADALHFNHITPGSTVQIDHTILSTAASPACTIDAGAISSLDFNIATDGTCGLVGIHDQINTDPLLGGLTPNGGPTLTHVLGINSPATNAGDPARTTPATDQRGFPRVDGGIIDIGAFELGITTFTVNSTLDADDANPGNGSCDDGAGNCTLRAAISEANALGDVQTIVIPAGLYPLTLPGTAEESNATGDLDITAPVTILGAGATTTIVDGNNLDRVFETRPGAGRVTMLGVTIRNGDGDGNWPNGIAGGFFNGSTGTAILEDVEIRDNGRKPIYNYNSILTLDRVTVAGNAETIQSDGNVAGGPGARARLNVVNSTLSGNGDGAANAGVLNILVNGVATSDLTVRNSTIADNNAIGIRVPDPASIIDVANTILTGNSLAECDGAIDSGSDNLIDDATCGAGNTPATNIDPTLADNGGETRTHALLTGSNAIDATTCPSLPTDQRGEIRPIGASCDIGAYEFDPLADPAQPGPIFTVNTAADTDDGTCSVADCSLREAINAANSQANGGGPDEIRFNIPGAGVQPLTPATNLPGITEALIMDGFTQPGAAANTLAVGDDSTHLIVVSGAAAPGPFGLSVDNGGTTLRGLVLTDWTVAIALQPGSNGNTVVGNFVGTDATGAVAQGGAVAGGTSGISVAANSDNNLIGGAAPADRNVVADYGYGIYVHGNGNQVFGNYVGLNAAGTARLLNGYSLDINGTANQIGGPNPGQGNVAVTTYWNSMAGGPGHVIQGNLIGTDASGSLLPGPGGVGLRLVSGSIGNLIGGFNPGEGNLIAGGARGIEVLDATNSQIQGNTIRANSLEGVYLFTNGSAGISIQQNVITDNGGLGMDLGGDGVTRNDFFDVDSGANGLQNAPVVQRALIDGGSMTVQGFLASSASGNFAVEIYASPTCDASSYGEGASFLGSVPVTTAATGYGSFQISVASVADGSAITALATNLATGDTSEFSRCALVGPNNDTWANAFPLALTPTAADQVTGGAQQFLSAPGQTRWFRFPVGPNSKVVVDLNNLPANYDLVLYRDIAKTYEALGAPANRDDLVKLSAEFAPEMFTPEMFTPEMFTPEMFTPEMFTPEMFTPEMFTPEMFTPEMFTPEMFTPEMFTPEMFTPEMFTPEMFTPEMFTPEMFTPEMFTPEMFTPEMFTPDQRYFAGAMAKSAVAVSGYDGQTPESVVANTWDESGDWYVSVKGRNGAYSLAAPFDLNVTVLGAECVNLTTDAFTPDVSGIQLGTAETLILVDSSRMGDYAAIQTRLGDLAAQANGLILDLANFPAIQAANTQADANFDCVYAKNLLAYATKEIVNTVRVQNPTLKYIVLVGNDNVIPFFRYPDLALLANENGYVPPVDDQTASQSSLRNNYFLSQDTYGASVEINRRNTSLPVPELAVGRLVESANDILATIDAYLSTGGTVPTPQSALVTGYDFLSDAAQAVNAELTAGLGITGMVTGLIDDATVAPADGWTGDDLRSVLLESGRHDVVFLAGHFSAISALAADYQSRVLASEIANAPVDMANSIIFSNGCHAGYNIVNEHGVPGVTVEPDWAQAFAAKGAVLIGGTGYQYGDTDFIEYNERLYVEFSRELRRGTGPVSVGDALVRAKQVYLSDTANLRPIHEKALLISALFGLPMLSIDMPGERYNPTPLAPLVPGTTASPANPGLTLGLRTADVSVSPVITPVVKSLTSVGVGPAVDTVYYTAGDPSHLVINPGEPVLPYERYNISAPGTVLRGVSFRGGSFSDVAGQIPLVGAATTELRGIHAPFIANVFFPITPWDVNYFDQLASSADAGITTLALLPVQYRSNAPDSVAGTLRVYDRMDFRFFYSDNTAAYTNITNTITNIPALAGPPTLPKILAADNGNGTVTFAITALADPSAGVQEVWVTYTGLTGALAGSWQSLDLTQDPNDSRQWTGTLDLLGTPAGDLRYMVQAANGVGLVGLSTNKGDYYAPDVDPADPSAQPGVTTPPAPVELVLINPVLSGDYGTAVSVSARLTSNGSPLAGRTLEFGLTTQRQSAVTDGNGIATVNLTLINETGPDTLRVSYPGAPGLSAAGDAVIFTVNPSPTTLVLETTTPTYSANGRADVTLLLTDGTGRPLREKSVLILVKDGGGAVVYAESAITNLFGQPVLRNANLSSGTYTMEAHFGDLVQLPGGAVDLRNNRYLPSTATLTLIQNTPPVAVAGGPYTVAEGGSVILNGDGSSDANPGQALAYTWDLNSVGGYEAAGITVTLSAAGLDGPSAPTISLQVCDVVNDCATSSATVTVTNVDPTLNIVTNSGPAQSGQPVTITVDATDPVDELLYSFDCDDDMVFEIGPQAEASAQCAFVYGGTYPVNVQVDDGDGGVVGGSTIVDVQGSIYLATIIAGSDQTVFEGETVAFNATFTDNGQPGPFTYAWAFGDGGSGSGLAQSHVYAQPGVYTATVQAMKNNVAVAEDSLTVNVLNGLFRYCLFAGDGDLSMAKEGTLTGCSVGATKKIQIDKETTLFGDVAAGETVTLKKDVQIQGSVTAVDGVKQESGVVISGSVVANGNAPTFTPLAPLPLTHGTTDIKIDKETQESLAPGDYAKLEVKDGATLTLSGGHYRFEEIKVQKEVSLIFDLSASPITLDVTGKIDMAEGVEMSVVGGDATGLLIRSTGDSIKLKKEGLFLGTFLAPNADIDLSENSHLTGALYGKKVDIKKSAQITGAPALGLLSQ